MPDQGYKHTEITRKIIGCAMAVHNTLGNGFQEIIYQRAMEIEFKKNGIGYQREREMPIYYDEHTIGKRRVDFFVENKIMVELKALTHLEEVHWAQTINYLEAYGLEVGLLLNFGAKKLEFKRFVNTKKHEYTQNQTVGISPSLSGETYH